MTCKGKPNWNDSVAPSSIDIKSIKDVRICKLLKIHFYFLNYLDFLWFHSCKKYTQKTFQCQLSCYIEIELAQILLIRDLSCETAGN